MTQWQTFECEECGCVEEIDTGDDAAEQICDCGGLMVCIDGEGTRPADAELTGSSKCTFNYHHPR